MNKWQDRFTQKVETVRTASRDRFEKMAEEVLTPLFEEYREFTAGQGLQSAVPLAKGGIRAFKFSIGENAYVLLTFRLMGLEQVEVHIENFVPRQAKHAPSSERVEMPVLDAPWARRKFEEALDGFVDTYVHGIEGSGRRRELAAAR